MHVLKGGARFLLATSLFALATAVHANETVKYKYDALGRLVESTSTGTVNNNVGTSVAYDPAGNRSNYFVNGVGGVFTPPPPPPPPSPPPPGPPPPPPPPPPPAGNNPPTAVANSGAQGRCTIATYDVTANDSDVDGDYPLSLVSVTGMGFSVLSSTTIEFGSGPSTGVKTGTYTVQDSRGATATATLSVTVTGGTCL